MASPEWNGLDWIGLRLTSSGWTLFVKAVYCCIRVNDWRLLLFVPLDWHDLTP